MIIGKVKEAVRKVQFRAASGSAASAAARPARWAARPARLLTRASSR